MLYHLLKNNVITGYLHCILHRYYFHFFFILSVPDDSQETRPISTFLLQRFVVVFCFAEIEYSFISRLFELFCIANFQIVLEAK